jgi:hypothetical protein
MVVDLMSTAADDLNCSKDAEPGMTGLNVSRCGRGGCDPFLCRRSQPNQPYSRRKVLVAPGLDEGVEWRPASAAADGCRDVISVR